MSATTRSHRAAREETPCPVPGQATAAHDARVFEAHLAEHAADWFPDIARGAARVSLLRRDVRPHSVIYEFAVDAGADRRVLLVKRPVERDGARPAAAAGGVIEDRPRRAAVLDPGRKSEVEFAALELIHNEFGRRGDPRFGTVVPLDFVPAERALVMEKISAPPLSAILLRSSRLPGRHPEAATNLLRNAGAWLRAYHGLAPLGHTGVRHAGRDEFVAYVARLADYVAGDERRAALVRHAAGRVAAAAPGALPSDLPLGLTHGDFAPRNVLVGEGGRVTVIDTLARWRAPVYDDLGDFVVGLRASKAQIYSRGVLVGPRGLARWEDAFLDGYFGGAPWPRAALRLFEVQALLDRWASARRTGLARGATGRVRVMPTTRFLSRYLERLVGEIDQGG